MSMRHFNARNILRHFANFVLDCLFPIHCELCGQWQNLPANPNGYLCANCANNIPVYQWLFCPVCNKKLVFLEPCQSHRISLKTLGAATSYDNEATKHLVWKYKYGLVEPLIKPLGEKLIQYINLVFLPYINISDGSWLITYIPLHPRRERWRGFNQAKLLAQYVSEKLGIPLVSTLKRTSFRIPQMEISDKKNRFANIKKAFAPIKNLNLKNKNIVLVDDIAASGATLIEAAKVLKRVKAKNIYGFVVARGQ